jgi:hypothetical protein
MAECPAKEWHWEADMRPLSGRLVTRVLAPLGGLVLGASISVNAQSPPPIQGVTGTIATQGAIKDVGEVGNTIVVGTLDGIEHAFHFTKHLLLRGGEGTEALQGLRAGRSVVVHYKVEGASEAAHEVDRAGDEGLKSTEGVVTRVDRGRKQFVIEFTDGKTETFRLSDRAAESVGQGGGRATTGETQVIVYYSDEGGQQNVAHFFKKISPSS